MQFIPMFFIGRARYYDPVIGRWLSVDPLMKEVPDMNPYHYTHNNPLNRNDPNGKNDDFIRVFNYFIAKSFPDAYRKVNTGEMQKDLASAGIRASGNLGNAFTTAGSVPTPATPYLLGIGTTFSGIATVGKLTNGGSVQDISGDVIGAFTSLIVKKLPLIGIVVDHAIDNFKTTDNKVAQKYRIHSGPAGGTTNSPRQTKNNNNESLDNLKPISTHSSGSSNSNTTQYQADIDAYLKSKGF